MENSKELFREAIARLTPNLSEKDRVKQDELLHEVFDEGKLLKDALNVSDQTIEYLYSQAYRLYKIGKFKDSSRYFHILYLLNGADLRFSMGIAACHHMQKEYQRAVEWYLVCSALDADSPLPYYHISDCFLKMGEKISALISLKMMQVRLDANDDPQFAHIKERALRMMETLDEEIKNSTVEDQFESKAMEAPLREEANQEEAANTEK